MVGEAEIDQFHLEALLVLHEEVLWLEVAMGDLHGVHVLDALDYLGEELPGVALAEVTVLLQSGEELSSFAETGYEEGYSWTR